MYAILKNNRDLNGYAKVVNNGGLDDTSFYVNGRDVSVSNCYREMPIVEQKEELEWFLKGQDYEFFSTEDK